MEKGKVRVRTLFEPEVYTFLVNPPLRILSLVLAGFFLFGIFAYSGPLVETHHAMGNGATHHVCPFIGTTPDCVSVLEHLSHWQDSFTAAFVSTIFLVLCAALCLCVVRLARHMRVIVRTVSTSAYSSLSRYFYLPRHALAEVFANGLIHPKLY